MKMPTSNPATHRNYIQWRLKSSGRARNVHIPAKRKYTWAYALTSTGQRDSGPRTSAAWISWRCTGVWDKNLCKGFFFFLTGCRQALQVKNACYDSVISWRDKGITVLTETPTISSLKGFWFCSHFPYQGKSEIRWKEMVEAVAAEFPLAIWVTQTAPSTLHVRVL